MVTAVVGLEGGWGSLVELPASGDQGQSGQVHHLCTETLVVWWAGQQIKEGRGMNIDNVRGRCYRNITVIRSRPKMHIF